MNQTARSSTAGLIRKSSMLTLAAVLACPLTVGAQSLLDRSPNISGNWTGAPGTVFFHFVHRFSTSDAPQRKVSNVPSFLVAAGLPKRVLVGFNYSTNSSLISGYPNEYELLARWAPLSQDLGAPVDLGAQVDYNTAVEGGDAELSVARRLGKARLLLAGRALSDTRGLSTRFAIAGGAAVRVNPYVALTGDYASLADLTTGERAAWSAGLHLAIPLTPHTFSLHATNTTVTTLQGASRGTDRVRYGFEFTVPLTLKRYFGRRAETVATIGIVAVDPSVRDTVRAAPPDSVAPVRPDTARPVVSAPPVTPPVDTTARTPVRDSVVRAPIAAPAPTTPRPAPARPAVPRVVTKTGMRNLAFIQPRLRIKVGTTVEWTNNDPLPHTVTATDKSFDSGLIQPGKTYRHTFTKTGTFDYFCVPHPFMKGVVVVETQ